MVTVRGIGVVTELANANDDEIDRWCRLNIDFDFGGHRFHAGQTFRVARSFQRKNRESLLTLDGNDDSTTWSSALVIHNVPISDVTLLVEECSA